MCKQLIGDFAIVKCDCYGEYKIINKLTLGEKLDLLNDLEVSLANDLEDPESSKKSGKILGVLKMSDADKKVVQPYLDARRNNLYECMISQINSNATINERLRATLWVKEKINSNSNQNETPHCKDK